MKSAEYDLQFLGSGLEQLEDYLLSNDIYRTPGIRAPEGESPYPQLTLGWLLLSQIRARVRAQPGVQSEEIERLTIALERIRSQWRAAWGRKARAEFSARLNLWRVFFNEYRENPKENVDRYSYEISRRVLLALLLPEADQPPDAELELLNSLDNSLQVIFEQGEFIWDKDLSTIFPKQSYWYLYGTPKININRMN
jgi:hypothetical protein